MSADSPTRIVGGYELLHEIGRGGMATVYLARQIKLERLVALKELSAFHADDPAIVRRFLNESQLAGSLTHANIVTVYEHFEHERLPYISMEYARRGSLRPLVGHLTPAQSTGVLVSVLNGLICAEEHSVVHRDLKPENLMIGDDGNVKIADFGIARAINRVATLGVHTETGTTIGTPDYMAPEQATGSSVTSATDRYSLGVIAYELLAGRKPFEGDELVSILYKHVNEPLPPPRSVKPELDDGLANWIARLLEKEPEDRIASAQQALDELEDIAIRLHGPRWRRLAALPAAEAIQDTSGDRSKVLFTFDPGRADAGGLDEVSQPDGSGRSGGASVTRGSDNAEPAVQEAERRDESAETPAVSEPAEAMDVTVAPSTALPPKAGKAHVEAGRTPRERAGERGPSGRRHRWWWAAALFLVAAGITVAAASLQGRSGGHASSSTSSSTTGPVQPSRIDIGTHYSIEIPAGWSCNGACRELQNGPTATQGFRLELKGPAQAFASVDRYPLEPGTTLNDVRDPVLNQLRGLAVGQIQQASRRNAWDYSLRTTVRMVVGSVRLFTGAAYHFQVQGFPGTDVKTILDTMVASLHRESAH